MEQNLSALVYAIFRLYSVVASPDEAINNMNSSSWMDFIYPFLTQAAQIITGYVILRSGFPKWLGWLVLVFGALTMVAWLVLDGVPPAVYYLPLLAMGITLLLNRLRSPQQLPQTT